MSLKYKPHPRSNGAMRELSNMRADYERTVKTLVQFVDAVEDLMDFADETVECLDDRRFIETRRRLVTLAGRRRGKYAVIDRLRSLMQSSGVEAELWDGWHSRRRKSSRDEHE